MNILIPNSWLKDYLKTNATPQEFATAMSLTSVSIERMEKVDDDIVYDIEVTTNRPDLMSIHGIAREASAVLPLAGYRAEFLPQTINYSLKTVSESPLLKIVNDSTLVNRIMAIVVEIDLSQSPKIISDRLEKTGIRSINNAVDITNYIMREIGHPSHVFDYDRLTNKTLIIRKSKKGEKITTLDNKEYILPGGDIVADDGKGTIVDLLGIMGTANSVVTNDTKRVVLFLDNNDPHTLRKTSMNLGIRTEAAVLNEKGLSPEIMLPTLLYGVELFKKYAKGRVISDIIDIYPNKPKPTSVQVSFSQIDQLIGISIPPETSISILKNLDFTVTHNKSGMTVTPPATRINDIEIPEDIIEEIARVYGYHKIPNLLPQQTDSNYYHQEDNEFYWITKIKEAFKLWGFNETYTYSMVSEDILEGPPVNALKLKNPLDEEHVYMRNTLIPSVIQVAQNNKTRSEFKLFEIANVYLQKQAGLPNEILHLAGVIKNETASFYDAKGTIEQLFKMLNITEFSFDKKDDGIKGAFIKLAGKTIGHIDAEEEIAFELDLEQVLKSASLKKVYVVPNKFPPIIEDVRIEIDQQYTFAQITDSVKEVSSLVRDVSLLDVYQSKKTFRITYIDKKRNLTNEDIAPVREKIIKTLEKKFKAIAG